MPIDAVDGIISPIVRVYIPNRDKPLFVVAKQDTISWEIEPALSDRKIVKEASEYAASIPVEHLLPHWDEVARFITMAGILKCAMPVYIFVRTIGMKRIVSGR